jgi:hypothetical protein
MTGNCQTQSRTGCQVAKYCKVVVHSDWRFLLTSDGKWLDKGQANTAWSGRARSELFKVLVNPKVVSQPARRSSKRWAAQLILVLQFGC